MTDKLNDPNPADDQSHSDKLEEIIADYLDQLNAGKRLDPKEILAKHPGYGHEILESLQEFINLGASPEKGIDLDTLGDFKIVREIGRGGMGVVYEAEQISMNRKVAIKVLSSHLRFSTDAVDKFRREAEAGGRQSHPGIVAIHGVGEHEGVHYIAQELVEGSYTFADKLEDLQRKDEQPSGYFREVAKFISEVADALDHAHESGVIHRDVKPSNILITKDGQPKVTDFGLAKIEDALALSRTGDFAGTPYYMSPEQAMSRRMGIDKRTDVYSLGATLYEMLTLNRPFRGETSHEVLKQIILIDPPNPIITNPRVPRDLSVICLKAMEKNPDRRYSDMKAFEEDLRRFLDGDVILAKPAGLGVRLWKRIKRNPLLSTAAGVALLAIISFMAYVLLISYPQIKHERDLAEKEKQRALAAEKVAVQAKEEANQEKERADDEAEKAKSEAEATKAVLDFLVGLFESSSPEETLGADITVKEVFDRGVEQITGKFEDLPRIRAKLLRTIGNVYESLGQYSEAEPLLEEAVELRRHTFGNDHSQTLSSIRSLAILYTAQGRYEEAERLLLEALDGYRRVLGDDHLDTLTSISSLANLYFYQDRYEETEPLYLKVLERRRRVLGNDHPSTLKCIHNLGNLYLKQGRYADAEPLYVEALEGFRRVFGNDHPDTPRTLGNLALLYKNQGRYEEAEPLYLEALEGRRRVLGKNHPDTIWSVHGLACLFMEQARYEEAESLLLVALEGYRRVFGNDHFDTLNSIHALAYVFSKQGRFEDSESLFLEALENKRRLLGEDHLNTLDCMNDFANHYREQSRFEKAGPLFLNTLQKCRNALGDNNQLTLSCLQNLVQFYLDQDRYEEGLPLAKELVERTPKDDNEYKARKELLDQIREKLAKEESAEDEDSKE